VLRRIRGRLLIALFLAIVGGCSSGGSGGGGNDPPVTPPPTGGPGPVLPDQPNILLIIADDMGLDAFGPYLVGAESPTTPTLDNLAADGLIFENLWVNPTCSPTRATLLTGKYGFRTGVVVPGDALDIAEQSMQSYLTSNAPVAYSQAVIGKWHLAGNGGNADHPGQMGIDHFAGILGGGVGQYDNWQRTINGVSQTSTQYITSELVDLSLDWVGQQTDPWFLWLAFNAPHTPFHLPPNNLHSQTLSGDQTDIDANPLNYYFAMIEAMDTEISRLLNGLTADERDNTIIIFIGDNGSPGRVAQDPFGRMRAKGSSYQGGIQTPMFVYGPGIRSGERETGLVNGTDFFATIAELAGVDVPTINDSMSFADLLVDETAPTRDFAYSEAIPQSGGPTSWTIRDAQHKLIQFDDGSQEVYDLLADPYEETELIAAGADVANIIQKLTAAAANIQ
jgi:arylsulfatase A-like enzyme